MQTEILWIDAAGKRVNHEAIRHQRAKDGSLHPGGLMPEQLNELGYQEITISVKPDDFSDKLYFRTEQDDAPYVMYTRKPQEMIDAANAAEVAEKLTRVRAVREDILNRLAGIAFVAQLNGDSATVTGYVAARQGLLDLTTGCPADPAAVDAFIVAKYSAIVAACPPALVSAFNGMNL